MAKIDWIIHCCSNGVVCYECKKVVTGFLQNTCNAHTHGMEKYHHMDFQMVLFLPPEEIGRILNTLGLRVQAGKYNNEFDGEPDMPISEDIQIEFIPCRDTWD
jgi:hypothetical protein